MENLGVIIGIAVAVAVAVFFGTRRATQTQRLQAAAIGLVVAGAVAAVAMYGLKAMRDSSEDISTVDSAMASAHALPMVGVVLDDVPGAQDRLREALREEIRQPTTQGPSRPLKLMSELRVTYIVPALKAADEASAAAAIDARAALLNTLKDSDLVVCKEFAVTGIQRSDKLDATGQKLMSDLLAALEKAYRSGRAGKPPDTGSHRRQRRRGACAPDRSRLPTRRFRQALAACPAAQRGGLRPGAEGQRRAAEGAGRQARRADALSAHGAVAGSEPENPTRAPYCRATDAVVHSSLAPNTQISIAGFRARVPNLPQRKPGGNKTCGTKSTILLVTNGCRRLSPRFRWSCCWCSSRRARSRRTLPQSSRWSLPSSSPSGPSPCRRASRCAPRCSAWSPASSRSAGSCSTSSSSTASRSRRAASSCCSARSAASRPTGASSCC